MPLSIPEILRVIEGLNFDIEDLATSVHPIGGINPVGSKESAVSRILG